MIFIKRLFLIAASLFFCMVLFFAPVLTADSVKNSAQLFFNSLLPSLFPFMIIACFLTLSGATELLCLPLYAVLRIFASRQMLSLWLSSFIGGYPAGASCICGLFEENIISRQKAEKLLPCLINPGPAFLLLVVGREMLGSVKAGAVLLCSQAVTSFIIAVLADSEKESAPATKNFLSADHAFVAAVSKSANAMLEIFAFIIAFGFIIDSMTAFLPHGEILSLPLEVTLGCKNSAEFFDPFLITAFLTGFGGFSVCFQVLSIAKRARLCPLRFWSVRFLAGFSNALLAKAAAKLFLTDAALCSANFSAQPVAIWSVNRLLGAVCFCSMLLITLQKLDNTQK